MPKKPTRDKPASGLSRQERKLSQALLDLHDEAMLIEELDGYLAGILVCPQTLPPSLWLPRVWNSDGGDEPVFEDLDHVNKVMGLVMDHYNAIATTLFERPETYGPLFATDNRNGDVLWEFWIEGFEKAVKLRPEAWKPLLTADLDTVRAWSGLMNLADVARADPRFSEAEIDKISADAHTRISGWVLDLNDWRLANLSPDGSLRASANPFASASSAKVGRNDPCPCGSGKKYKKCHGLN
jgi:uncharacterized protein